jgi:hypothetical protein
MCRFSEIYRHSTYAVALTDAADAAADITAMIDVLHLHQQSFIAAHFNKAMFPAAW